MHFDRIEMILTSDLVSLKSTTQASLVIPPLLKSIATFLPLTGAKGDAESYEDYVRWILCDLTIFILCPKGGTELMYYL